MEASQLVKNGLVNKAQEEEEAKKNLIKTTVNMSNVSDWYLEQEAGSQLVNSICPVAQNNSSLQHLCDPKQDIPNLCLGKHLNLKWNFLFLLI